MHRKLKEAGCYIYRDGANHPVWKSPITGKTFTTSYHDSQEAKKKTVSSISKQSGVKL
ncbi:MAG: type II toxin-antitoxin system HicA family toxin [Bacteroidales bacterium]|nr:type II toxin-antitoxin system HicA family toxin [Bacteroidales bacterium]